MSRAAEPPIDPSLPIIDSHHHLFDRASEHMAKIPGRRRFLLDDYVEFIGTSHNLVATVAVQVNNMYRAEGDEAFRSVGETEFLNGQAAMSASGLYGPTRVAMGIIGAVDLRYGKRARTILSAHIDAAPQRFKGIRQSAMWDEDPNVVPPIVASEPGLYRDADFLDGVAQLAPLGLTFDAFVLAPQLDDVAFLANHASETQIVLNHLGQPVGIGRYKGKLAEEFPAWRNQMGKISKFPNVVVKMGGLGSIMSGSPHFRSEVPATSEALADEWRPYAETAIELFGADRVMYASDLPSDGCGPFANVCNAYQ